MRAPAVTSESVAAADGPGRKAATAAATVAAAADSYTSRAEEVTKRGKEKDKAVTKLRTSEERERVRE